jgi:hypothetical protein
MPKPRLNLSNQTKGESILNLSSSKELSKENKLKLDMQLRKPRSENYIDSIRMLDAGGHTHNHQQVNNIINVLRQEFPEIEISGIMLGIVSKCYLGVPYEVHSLNLSGGIIEHYQKGKSMPGGLEKARSIAIYGGYEFIEVYVDRCRAVSSNGTVSVINT